MKLVCLKRDLDGAKYFADYTAEDKREGKVPLWQRVDGSADKAARRWDQYFYALRTNEARAAFAKLSQGTTASPAQFLEACEAAWRQPGLSAMQTVEAVRHNLERAESGD